MANSNNNIRLKKPIPIHDKSELVLIFPRTIKKVAIIPIPIQIIVLNRKKYQNSDREALPSKQMKLLIAEDMDSLKDIRL